MAPSQNYIVLLIAILECFHGLIIFAVIDDSLENKFILRQSARLIESDCFDLPSKRNFFRLRAEYFLFLEIKNGVVDSQIQNHWQLWGHDGGQDENAPQKQFLFASFGILHPFGQDIVAGVDRANEEEQDNPKTVLLLNV